MPKIELTLITSQARAIGGIREVQRAAQELNNTIEKGNQRQKGLIEDLEEALRELEEARKKAFSVEDIEKYNRKIAEAKGDLQEYERAGVKANENIKKSGDTLLQSIGKWAVGFVTLGKLVSELAKSFKDTVLGMNLMTTAGQLWTQVVYNLVSGHGQLNTSLAQSLAIGKQLNALRQEERESIIKVTKAETEYFKVYSDALDKTKPAAERLEILNKAEEQHTKILDAQKEILQKRLIIVEQQLAIRPESETAINAEIQLQIQLEEIERRRFSETRDLIRSRSAIELEIIDDLDRVNQEAAQKEEERLKDKAKLYADYWDWYRDQVDKAIRDEQKAKAAQWDFDMDIAWKLFRQNQKLAKEQWEELMKESGVDPDSEKGKKLFEDIKHGAERIVGVIADITDNLTEDATRRRELYDEQIAETQRSLELEATLMEEGFANNVNRKRAEVEELKKLRAKALKEEEEAIRKQRVADSIAQGINLATSVTQILKEYTKIPVVGLALAAVAIAALFTLFASAKSKSSALIKLAEGGTGTDIGMITGKSHTEGGEHFLSHVEVERGERWGVLNRKASDKFGKTFDNIISSFNKNEMPDFIAAESVNNIRVDNSGPNSRLDKVIAEQRKLNEKFGKKEQMIIVGSKKIITKGNKVRIVG